MINRFDQIGVSQVRYPNNTDILVPGTATVQAIAHAITDTDKFLVSDSGEIKFRTGAEVLSDISFGMTGIQGATGVQGPTGFQGVTGLQGSTEFVGPGTIGTLAMFSPDVTSVADSALIQSSNNITNSSGSISSLSGLSVFNELQVNNQTGNISNGTIYADNSNKAAFLRVLSQNDSGGDLNLYASAWGGNFFPGGSVGPDSTTLDNGTEIKSEGADWLMINAESSGKVHVAVDHVTKLTATTVGVGFKNKAPLGVIHPADYQTPMCFNVGPRQGIVGSWISDSTYQPAKMLSNSGTLNHDGEIELLPTDDTSINWCGYGFVCSSSSDPTFEAVYSNFSFSRDQVSLSNTVGSVITTDSTNYLCVLGVDHTISTSNTLRIKNRLPGTGQKIGYWITCWGLTKA